jgi:tetratricopeptide (TPR) repeat protein
LLLRAQNSENLAAAAPKIDHRASNEQAVSIVPAAEEAMLDFNALDLIEKRARELASRGQRREALLLVSQAEQSHAGQDNQGARAGTSQPPTDLVASLRRLKGIVLLELQDFTAARVVLADAARLNPGDAAARFYYGVALEHSGDSLSAIQEYEAALKIRPDYEAVREFLRNLKEPD